MSVRVIALDPALAGQAAELAGRLGLQPAENPEFELQLTSGGLQLQEVNSKAGPVRVDFVTGALAHRRQFGGGTGQMIARAVGIQRAVRPYLLDATAGLGRDAFVLACLGCRVDMIERHPLVAALLQDGLQRALLNSETAAIVSNMQLQQGNAIELMQNWQGERPQVIYLDPMFPERSKSALVKKEMRLFQPLVGGDEDAHLLLEAALALASHRVVVKRPRIAPALAGSGPGYVLQGKSSRFDIYPLKSLRETAS